MADNVPITSGAGTNIASDFVNDAHHQRVKLSLGPDGSVTDAEGGAGAVSAAVQRVTLASDDPAVAALGATGDAAATQGSTGTISAKLRTATSQLNSTVTALQIMDDWDENDRAKVNLIAGQAGITGGAGAVTAATPRVTFASDAPAPTAGYSAEVSITRTNDTNAYGANDVIGAATGSTAAVEFTSMGPSGGRVIIVSAELEIAANAVISGETSYRLYLYNVTPPGALGDNAAFNLPSGDRTAFLGYVDLGTVADFGDTLYVQTDNIMKAVKLSGTSIFGYLVTSGAYTPTASRVYKMRLHTVAG
jgi:hypothetical protein